MNPLLQHIKDSTKIPPHSKWKCWTNTLYLEDTTTGLTLLTVSERPDSILLTNKRWGEIRTEISFADPDLFLRTIGAIRDLLSNSMSPILQHLKINTLISKHICHHSFVHEDCEAMEVEEDGKMISLIRLHPISGDLYIYLQGQQDPVVLSLSDPELLDKAQEALNDYIEQLV